MPLIHCDFFSQALQLSTSMDVILPLQPWKAQATTQESKHPTLYLLHALSDDHTIWQRRTSIERYVEDDEVRNSPNDLFWLARRLARQLESKHGASLQPRLYQWCGQQDFLYRCNVKFRKHAERLGLDLTFAEGPGDHTWKYWDEQIQIFLEMIHPAPIETR